MAKHPRGHLSPKEREEIRSLYSSGKFSLRQLAEKYGVSKTTIQNVKNSEEKPGATFTPPPKAIQEIKPAHDDDPIRFRIQKLREIEADIQVARARGSVHVLPPLHRLHLTTHDELQKIREETQDVDPTMDAAGLISTITTTISRLPPTLRHEILDRLEALESGDLIPFPEEDQC